LHDLCTPGAENARRTFQESQMQYGDFKYRMFYAPSPCLIDRAAGLGCNWVLLHSAGIEDLDPAPRTGRPMDRMPIYFEDYPKVAQVRHHQDADWIEPLRQEVAALCDRAAGQGLKAAFHTYESVMPHVFEREYPELVTVWHRPTQTGVEDVHSHVNPDNPAVWDLMRSKYAEFARTFPKMDMIIITTWDGKGSYLCVPDAKMPIHRRLAKLATSALEGVRSVRKDCQVVFRLWGRNWPAELYREGHKDIARLTGVANAAELMQPVCREHNDPDKVIPALLADLPPDMPIMYKSTNMDIAEGQTLTLALGKYPADREQILEVSYERYHEKSYPWCKLRHIRRGLEAAKQHKLAGFLTLSLNMGSTERQHNPEIGNLGRMNTWLLDQLLHEDKRSDLELVSAWLEKEFGSAQPAEAAEIILGLDDLSTRGLAWGTAPTRVPFGSPHMNKVFWTYDLYSDPKLAKRIVNPTRELIEQLIAAKYDALRETRAALEEVKAAGAAMHPGLFKELIEGLGTLADSILLHADWAGYILMQYGIEKGLFPADRPTLGRMSRYVERFIATLAELKDTESGKKVFGSIAFPDPFPLT
jgi:hypothetical protein